MALSLDGLVTLVREAFARASITTAAGLKDDAVVRATARHIYDVIPFPINLAIKMSVGIEGLEGFAIAVRDKLVASGVTDLAKLGPAEWRAVLASSLTAVPALGRLLSPEPATAKEAVGVANGSAASGGQPVPAPEASAATARPSAASGPARPRVWYLRRNEAQYGPWPDAAFVAFVEEGRLDRGDLVWRDGFPGWVALRDLPHLSDRLVGRP